MKLIDKGDCHPYLDYYSWTFKYDDVKEAIEKEREDLRALVWELAKEYGGAVLHYNEKIDDIHTKRFGNFEK